MIDPRAVLQEACRRLGVDCFGAEVIRQGENTLYRLPHGVVARVTRAGQLRAATKEVRVSRWLQSLHVPVVEALPDLDQPAAVGERAVTFWRELPDHRYSTLAELAIVLRRLHDLPSPDFELPTMEPFVRLRERIAETTLLSPDDRGWLLDHLDHEQDRYTSLPAGRPWCAIHGDAWAGNVVVTTEGPILLDLERFAYGPPEWDLTSLAVDYGTFGSCTAEEWTEFCSSYGYDVTTWRGFEILRAARELRKVTFALQTAQARPEFAKQAQHRLECIQGKHGPRPWGWVGMP